MAKSLTARFGLQRWSADSDTQQRSEFDSDAAQIDALAAKAGHGTIGARPAPTAAWADGLWLITDATGGGIVGTLYYCDGAAWTAFNSKSLDDSGYLGIAASAADSAKLGGVAAASYAQRSQGLFAARPAPAIAGRRYYATNTDQEFIDDGTAWHEVLTATTGLAKAGGTATGEIVVPDLSVSGLTGSVQPSRYVGRTAAGAPTTGAHVVGDWVLDLTGLVFICTVAGTPGTWVQGGSAAYLAKTGGALTGVLTSNSQIYSTAGLAVGSNSNQDNSYSQINIGSAAVKGLVVKAAASQSGNTIEVQNVAGTPTGGFDANGAMFAGSTLLTTTATAGAASALPGAPAGYVTVVMNGSAKKLAYWNP